jgi:hypothetical protein
MSTRVHKSGNYLLLTAKSTGQFCSSYLKNLTTTAECDGCLIKSFQSQVNSPFAVDDGMREEYAAMTSSCKATGYPTTVATSLLLTSYVTKYFFLS